MLQYLNQGNASKDLDVNFLLSSVKTEDRWRCCCKVLKSQTRKLSFCQWFSFSLFHFLASSQGFLLSVSRFVTASTSLYFQYSDQIQILSYKVHMISMLFFRNPVYWIVPAETGELAKGTLVKLLGSLQRRLRLTTQGHLITLILEDFWEAEADWWELLMCDTWKKLLKPQGFALVLPIWKAVSRGSL